MPVDLLQFSRGGGCGCKLDPVHLRSLLSVFGEGDDRLLVDFRDRDDAAVYELDNDKCLIQTADFFLPIVSDPFDFGRIAAANALSDVYAMGGKPLMAISLLGWPRERIPLEYAAEVLRGAEAICKEAGIGISGGHSIETSEPVFGLSVNGLVSRTHLKRKNTCREGDFLYMTKPLGLGLLSNAIRQGILSESGYKALITQACTLNAIGAELGGLATVTAMTDITGFGLLGHLSEMLGDGHGAVLELKDIPVLEEAREIALKMVYPNITTGNYNFVKDRCDGLDGLEFLWLCDPQTSGGLLISASEPLGMKGLICIGRVESGQRIRLV